MLAHRVIPVMLCRGRTLVKGERFDSWRSVGVAAQAVRIMQARQCDELVLLDIGATPKGRGPDLDLVRELSEVCFMPLAVGEHQNWISRPCRMSGFVKRTAISAIWSRVIPIRSRTSDTGTPA